MDVFKGAHCLFDVLIPFWNCPSCPGRCRVSHFKERRGDLSQPPVLFIYISSFNLPPSPRFSPPFFCCHLCLCVCHRSPHLTGWHQSPVLFLLLKLRLTLHSGGGPAAPDTLLLTNSRSQNIHDISNLRRSQGKAVMDKKKKIKESGCSDGAFIKKSKGSNKVKSKLSCRWPEQRVRFIFMAVWREIMHV